MGRQQFGDYEASNTAHGRGVVMTIQSNVQTISVEKLATMELPEFARLWTVSVHCMYCIHVTSIMARTANMTT